MAETYPDLFIGYSVMIGLFGFYVVFLNFKVNQISDKFSKLNKSKESE